MSRSHKPDPYNGFKSDVERRRALNFRTGCLAAAAVAITASQSLAKIQETLFWLKTLFM